MFNQLALEIFQYQASHVSVYNEYLSNLKINPSEITQLHQIPFLPIRFFKTHKVFTNEIEPNGFFESSGTTNSVSSKNYFQSLEHYHKNALQGFEFFFSALSDYTILALLPSYLEREHSSLISMVQFFMNQNPKKNHGYFLKNEKELFNRLMQLEKANEKTLLIGVSFALFDFAEKFSFPLHNTTIIETGGMKGRKEEMTREDLHQKISKSFHVKNIASEYGMTELFSQAWSVANGIFFGSATMKVFCRDITDPFQILGAEESGAINVMDLANIDTCSFIATDDAGIVHADNTFEVRGRIDASDIRGCNLLV